MVILLLVGQINFKASNETDDDWNKMTIRVQNGQSEIKINNEVQNRVLLKGNSPSKLVIRNESYGEILFKNIKSYKGEKIADINIEYSQDVSTITKSTIN